MAHVIWVTEFRRRGTWKPLAYTFLRKRSAAMQLKEWRETPPNKQYREVDWRVAKYQRVEPKRRKK